MAYFMVTRLKVFVFVLGVTQGIRPISAKEPDLSAVANILQNLFKTYTHSLRQSHNFDMVTDKPPQIDPTVERVINRKVLQLNSYLEDDNLQNVIRENKYMSDEKNKLTKELSNEDDNITLEGEEETTIIEFLPDTGTKKPNIKQNDTEPREFKDKVKKFKKIRDKIKSALIEESVSFKTQKLVTHTLDDMLAIMVRSQCPSNSNFEEKLHDSLRSKKVARTTKDLAKNWTEQWHAIKNKYNKIWKENFSQQPNPARKLFMFFEQIQEFLTNIVNDTEHISKNYKVICKLVRQDNAMDEIYFNNLNLVNFRTGKDKKKYDCPTFKMCSDELRQFMTRFYNNLNDTAVSTFRNYAAMYQSDVNSNGSGEKESVIEVINKLGDTTEQLIKKIIKKAIENFDIDHDKDKDENIRLLRFYVTHTIERCLHTIKSYLNSEIMSLRARLIDNLKQDLRANLDVDLGNLATEFKDGICRDFSSCNSRVMRRSFENYYNEKIGHTPVEKNKVYVKLQMNFDKKLKKDIARGNVDFLDYAFIPMKYLARQQSITATQKITVTRTTQPDITTQAEIPKITSKTENLENIPKKKFETTLKKAKSEDILKKQKIERMLKKDNLENLSKFGKIIKEKSKEINLKEENIEVKIESSKKDRPIFYIEMEDSEKNLKTEQSEENNSKDAEHSLDRDAAKIVKPSRTTREMGSTRLFSQEVSVEILQ